MRFDELKKIRQEILNSNFDDLCSLCTKKFCLNNKEDKDKCFFPIKELVDKRYALSEEPEYFE